MSLDCRNLGTGVFVRDDVAIALDYGFHRNLENAFASPKEVVFVHMGHISTTCVHVRYSPVCTSS